MGIIENTKEVAELIKQYNNIELNRKIINLEKEIADSQTANRKLEAELTEARSDLAKRAAMHFRSPYYWQDGDEVPFCPKCWEGKDKLVAHLSARQEGFGSIGRRCLQCGTNFWEGPSKSQGQIKPRAGPWS